MVRQHRQRSLGFICASFQRNWGWGCDAGRPSLSSLPGRGQRRRVGQYSQAGAVQLPKLPHNARAAAARNTSCTGCTFQTPLGYYLTAVGGGGRTTDVIHSNATQVGSWERFNLYYQGYANVYAIQASVTFNYLTAVGGGGRTTDVIHSDAIQPQAWERFNLVLLG